MIWFYISEAPRGTPQIEVTFSVFEGDITHIFLSAQDIQTKQAMPISKTE